MSEHTTMPLSMARAGHLLQLIEIRAGHKLTRRLAEMGLTRGVTLQVVIGRGMAHKLLVAVVERTK
jgi:Fe2+ transport system protein FeoA